MANLIPMAGLGSRFSREGYTLPKPLIPVSGIPMVVRAIRAMPPSDKWIFIVRQEHIDSHRIDRILLKEVPGAAIIPLDYTTEGQASTCLLAEKHLDRDEELFIAACDNASVIDAARYRELRSDLSVDAVAWTLTRRERLRTSPHSFGWYRLARDGLTIEDVSVKVPVSDNPYGDHAVVASFWFRRAGDFIEAANLMTQEDYRINGEFYVDAVPLFLKRLGKRSVIFDVDLFVGWGTPAELRDYEIMERACRHGSPRGLLDDESRRLLPLWREYFQALDN